MQVCKTPLRDSLKYPSPPSKKLKNIAAYAKLYLLEHKLIFKHSKYRIPSMSHMNANQQYFYLQVVLDKEEDFGW